MNYTDNYNLGLPLPAEKYDVAIFNTNNGVIDGQMKINADAIATHVADKSNPHQVTAAQVGLGSVDNTSDAVKPVSTPQEQYIARVVTSEETRAKAAETANANAITALQNAMPGIATTTTAGLVKPDGTTITIEADGTIHGTVQIDVDSALSPTSTNPVENRVINSAIETINTTLAGKQDALTFDSSPTSGSSNPVESGGIYTALSSKADSSTTYTKTEVDNLISTLEAGNDWKEAVETYADIATTYPNPQDGWTVNVKDTDYTYRYDGTNWVVISANAIPNATTSVNGLMSTTQVVDHNANTLARHTHSNKTILDNTTASFTTAMETKLSGIADSADAVSFTPSLTTGTEVGKITINGTETSLYAPASQSGSTVAFTPTLVSGTEIGQIEIDGISTSMYAPTPITADATTSAHGLMSTADKVRANYTNIAYATCNTIGSEAVKVATVVGNTSWGLEIGAIVGVLFSSANSHYSTAASPCQLNVNNTGAFNIYYNNSATSEGEIQKAFGYANGIIYYMYNGTYWMWMGAGYDEDTRYTAASLGFGYGTCSTAAAVTEKTTTISGYKGMPGGIIAVRFENDVPAGSTLAVNSSGAVSIMCRGESIKSGMLNAGDTGLFMLRETPRRYFELISSDASMYICVTGTLGIGQTSLTLSNAGIAASSTIDGPYADVRGVKGDVTSVATGLITCTFEAQSVPVTIKCYVRK